jgi:hypothetical protein
MTAYHGRRFVGLLAAALGVALAAPALAKASTAPVQAHAPAPASASLQATGPKVLVITYRAEARHRPAFRTYLSGPMTRKLRALKARRAIADYKVFYSWYRQPNVWDAMLLIRFHDPADVAGWNAIERDSPGGLDAEGLALARPELTVSADLEWTAVDPAEKDRVYYFLPYEYQNAGEYRQYIPGYLLPQLKGWMEGGVLAGYDILMNRYPVGPSWDSLLIQKYRDFEAFGRRNQIMESTRVGLRTSKSWMDWHERKGKIREETENTIADLLPQ